MRRLTPRQRQIIELASTGLSARQIGTELGISYHTVRTQETHILRRMRARNMTEACVKYDRERAEIEAAELLRARIMREVG